ncbi:MAG: hypothetical protein JXM70_16955 [Pirellulales bacterium]|nr:hypothetical protein [Pirellulales bacterium]
MNCQYFPAFATVFLNIAFLSSPTLANEKVQSPLKFQIQIESGHTWRPPFGLDRVGRPLEAVVTVSQTPPVVREIFLVGYCDGKEVSRHKLVFPDQVRTARVRLEAYPAEIAVLFKSNPNDKPVELARRGVPWPAFEAEAVARPERIINPVDLGTILVPDDWLLLAGGQKAQVELVALNRNSKLSSGQAVAWYESAPGRRATTAMRLTPGQKTKTILAPGPCSRTLKRDTLHVVIESGNGKELWHKQIQVMIVPEPPKWPEFGVVETKLRYDAPISVRKSDGKFSFMNYNHGWDAKLKDVVVVLPNGQRFVFWRGSSYIPFWASRHNTGFCYEWAESKPPADASDAVEPLMDKELRYGRVRIMESTTARVHVRWSYQSCDFNYKVWGDSAVEDYYFYPDGFGTRVLTLQSVPESNYEVSEFIVLTPQSMYPLSVLPPNLLDVLFLDGKKNELTFPSHGQAEKLQSRGIPAIFRVHLHKNEPLTAIYFSPLDKKLPEIAYGPFYDKSQLVTPVYWGSHWPLARGNTTGGAIDARVSLTPAHNSIVTWGYYHRPTPLHTTHCEMLDALGRSKTMVTQIWAWLIGMSDADDARLLQWAHSFSKPPSLDVNGAQFDVESYAPDRRAIRLVVEGNHVTIKIKPDSACVNPVFELSDAPKKLSRVLLDGRVLDTKQYAWDGKTLWLNATITKPTNLQLELSE